VADEVGLGKTLIAKGLIAKLADYHKDWDDDLFKVLYICSNISIAAQNIQKLRIHPDATIDGIDDTRLSMQHLKIAEQENDSKILDGYIQLIPLTPGTSFHLSAGQGIVKERALMYAVLRKLPIFGGDSRKMRKIFIGNASKNSFENALSDMKKRIKQCDKITKGKYSPDLLKQLESLLPEELIADILAADDKSISKLRSIFAKISISRLKPDLVIMDEFQRFRELINAKLDTETGVLAEAFLKNSSGTTNTLLLSATPYKLYQTLEETNESSTEDHYQEFFELMNFLIDDKDKSLNFIDVWKDFSDSLRHSESDFPELLKHKNTAESHMYETMCRTERLLINSETHFIDDSDAKTPISVDDMDIISFINADQLSDVPIDYVKSCPYLLSFMDNYKYKDNIREENPKISLAARKTLFLDENAVDTYKKLPANNSRLKKLTDVALESGAELLLWTPPSFPYYELQGPFKGKEHFSKVLVFSCWQMVPKMIACCLSYECERRTIGQLYAKQRDKTSKGYFAATSEKRRNRFPEIGRAHV
jgi:hypothetical protein